MTTNNSNVIQLFGANGQPINQTSVITPASPIYTDHAHSQVSTRYNHVQTIDVVNALRDAGWEITKTATQRVKDESRNGYQKHYVWMKPMGNNNKLEVGDTEMRLLMSNAHDGTAAYRLQAGLHRLVCSNGLVVSIGDFSHIAIRHTSEDIEQLAIDGAIQIAAMAPKINETISKMRERQLTPDEKALFAAEAVAIAWPQKDAGFINADSLLITRRGDDQKSDVWSVFNSIQENLIRGGLSANNGRRTRAVNSPVRDVAINRALFQLATKKAA